MYICTHVAHIAEHSCTRPRLQSDAANIASKK